ncbi:LysR family transcriptional regulator [Loktanella sp. S4079]|uniref:LysR family transcriptional regulator n=1 Tax=Loktanella sp. S4079 TaxID=579483 RepID=UPI0005F9CFE7|nr:LysR family transcriptional regulator [Loktanella sp. S4079]KJZ18424.1 LysR family transcriptional regulator [Loktanella sp. S4079]
MNGSRVNDILLFLLVVETGSFVAAGKTLGLSRSTAGKAVARLEESYGTRLLNRSARALDLTEAGKQLYAHGQNLRAVIEATDRSLESHSGVPRGVLRITAPDAIGRRLILPTVRKYLQTWPDTKIEMSFSDRIDSLIEKGFDLAIRVGVDVPDLGFVTRTLLRDEAILCAAPTYFADRTRPQTVEHLTLHNLLQFTSEGERQGWYIRQNDGTRVRVHGQVRLRLDSAEALRAAALDGLGIALLPQTVVGVDLTEGRLERVLPDHSIGQVPILALYPHKRLLDAKVRNFIDLLSEDLKEVQTGSPSQ